MDFLKNHLMTMAQYHGWAYEVLLGSLERVNEADYRRDAGLFFGSIHRTLNHLLLVDRLWFGRFTGNLYPVRDLGQEVCVDRQHLADEIVRQAGQWASYAETADPAGFPESISYLSTEGGPNRMPYFETLMHVFNHGTHHRGQISAAMTQMRYEAPEMDLFYFLKALNQ
jgi:uncharacterized damage-inducible protein DinB